MDDGLPPHEATGVDHAPPPARRKRRRWLRLTLFFVVAAVYVYVMWFYVFPWVDRTFVNQPAL